MSDSITYSSGSITVSGNVIPSASEAMIWQPTLGLRFVERDGRRILQQGWCGHNMLRSESEWRDVPLVVEDGQQ